MDVPARFHADDMSVRLDGKPLCVTSHSLHLDNSDGYAIKSYAERQKWARTIAAALNEYFEQHSSHTPTA